MGHLNWHFVCKIIHRLPLIRENNLVDFLGSKFIYNCILCYLLILYWVHVKFWDYKDDHLSIFYLLYWLHAVNSFMKTIDHGFNSWVKLNHYKYCFEFTTFKASFSKIACFYSFLGESLPGVSKSNALSPNAILFI